MRGECFGPRRIGLKVGGTIQSHMFRDKLLEYQNKKVGSYDDIRRILV